MIYDALLILWDCSQAAQKETSVEQHANEGDSETFTKICEIAKSHHKIQNFIEVTNFHARNTQIKSKNQGLYAQALSEGLMEVLQTYKKTLLEVEQLVLGNPNYTLILVYSYVEKFRGLFDTLNKIISIIKDRRLVGCQILSITQQYVLNGNKMIHEAVLRIFSNINKVFLNQVCSWLLYGELKDPYKEFFICCHQKEDVTSCTFQSSPSTNPDQSLVNSLQDTALDCGYSLNSVMIPHFMPLSVAQEILFIGKTVILFGFDPRKLKRHSNLNARSMLPTAHQYGASDSRRFTIWEDNEAEFHEKLQKLKDPQVFEIHSFRIVVREIKECVTKHLWTVAVEEAQLIHELHLMKDFYLLGRGELFLELLRLSADTLDGPTTRTSSRDMNHAFQLAARAVLLGNSADIDKFSFDLPYVKQNISINTTTGDNSSNDGWSSIILKYNFKWPLHLLFTPEVLARYNDMFRLLLRIKKTQHDLHALWKTYKQATNFSMCQLHNKLMFLMDNLQHYLQADVLESNFSRFMEAVERTNDFERLKKAHATFLAEILSQSFLTITPSESDSTGAVDTTDSLNNPVFCNVMELVKLCRSFCSLSQAAAGRDAEEYYLRGYSDKYNKLVKQLMQLLVSVRDRPCGVYLARLLMRLDYNRWLSGEARLTQSVTNMLR